VALLIYEKTCQTGLTGFTGSLLRLRRTLGNLDPFPTKIKVSLLRAIGSVPFFWKSTNNPINPVNPV
jgi:hypothetical protein